jgi:hypothetical protein
MHLREVVEEKETETKVKEVEEEEKLEQTQPKHPTLLNPNHNYHQPPLYNSTNSPSSQQTKPNKMSVEIVRRDMEHRIALRI